jgi:hypothetical protein
MMNRKTENQKAKRFQVALAAAALAVLISGCGQTAYQEAGNNGGNGGGGNTGGNGGGGTGGGNTGGGNTGGTNGGTTNSVPTATYSFKMTGSGNAVTTTGGSMNVSTNTLLKVAVSTGQHYGINGASGYTVGFNCEQFTVTVLGESQTVFVKAPNYVNYYTPYNDPCASAQTSATLDFSDRLGPGHNSVTIQVSNAMYDNCRLYNDPYNGGCPMTSVYSTHTVGGQLQVFTNTVQ